MRKYLVRLSSKLALVWFSMQPGGIAFAQSVPGSIRDSGFYHGHGMMWGGGGYGGFGMILGFIIMLLLIAAVVFAVILLLRSTGFAGFGQNRNAALDTLKERFAKGEIDAKEFDERKRLLSE